MKRKILAIITAVSFMIYCVELDSLSLSQAKRKESKRTFIVCTTNDTELRNLEKQYGESTQVNANEEGHLKENQMVTVSLTESEAEAIEETSGVCFVEEDILVEANQKSSEKMNEKRIHKKKTKRLKKNKGKAEWNARMIRADQVEQTGHGKQDRIKIAVLDSGVDYANDIDLAETVSLVPGEEEMNPLFMDGSGHGNSVAGLIAATENEEGITGINPNAEIYSIRVLDNNNQAPVSRVIEGIYMAIDQKVNIINMSFGVSQYSSALEQAVRDAKDAGILLVAAAGNTGGEGVQYPAALDEVIAVGSVDKDGEVAEDSAIGEELEIVAPGELVRSTGELGNELVSSGTSLAAPQVAAVASLIWEKDTAASAEFVRRLLNESANQYGEKEKYGNGLLDASYALDHYALFKQQYASLGNQEEDILEENEEEVLCFEDTGCIEGSWSESVHSDMPEIRAHSLVKKGARYPDVGLNLEKMTLNPWWHGYWQKKLGDTRQYTVNYVAAYVYITRLADKERYGGTADVPSGMSDTVSSSIISDVNGIDWDHKDTLEGYDATKGQRRAFIWGMALHSLADAFAHSAYRKVDGKYYAITHSTGKCTGADKVYVVPKRYRNAREAVKLSIKKYANSEDGSYQEFSPVYNDLVADDKKERYKMRDIYNYVYQVSGYSSSKAAPFANYSYSVSTK